MTNEQTVIIARQRGPIPESAISKPWEVNAAISHVYGCGQVWGSAGNQVQCVRVPAWTDEHEFQGKTVRTFYPERWRVFIAGPSRVLSFKPETMKIFFKSIRRANAEDLKLVADYQQRLDWELNR